ncbi:hypothetical protein Tco_0546831 [Tanacetum coccineum]
MLMLLLTLLYTTQHPASYSRKGWYQKEALGRKGCSCFQSTFPIEEGDPEPDTKFALSSIQCLLQAQTTLKASTSQDKKRCGKLSLFFREILRFLMDSPEVNDGKTVSGLVLHMFVDKKYPLSVNLIIKDLEAHQTGNLFTDSWAMNIHTHRVFDREDLDDVYKLVMDIYQDKIPEGFDKVLWGDLIVMFNPDEQDEFWNSQHEWKVVSWKLHSSSGVHTLMTDEGLVVHMLIEKKYPLKKEILMQMLKLKLESEEESTMALELIRFIKKSWLVQDQTVLGKDYSNLLIADSLLKTIWFINAPCYDNEALASPNTNDEELSIPEQTATGKGTSNPLMAGSLPKTTKPT